MVAFVAIVSVHQDSIFSTASVNQKKFAQNRAGLTGLTGPNVMTRANLTHLVNKTALESVLEKTVPKVPKLRQLTVLAPAMPQNGD